MDEAPPPLTADGSRRNFCAWVADRSALRTVAATVAKRDGKRGLCCTVWILSRGEQRRPASYQWEKGGTFIAGRNAREVRLNERAGRRGSAHGAPFEFWLDWAPSRFSRDCPDATEPAGRQPIGRGIDGQPPFVWLCRRAALATAHGLRPRCATSGAGSIGAAQHRRSNMRSGWTREPHTRVDARTTYAGGREDHTMRKMERCGWTRGPHDSPMIVHSTRLDASTIPRYDSTASQGC